jgi:glucuronate isomerase
MIGNDQFLSYMVTLGQSAGIEINSYDDLLNALSHRIKYFHTHQCRLSDHGLEYVYANDFTKGQVDSIFLKRIQGETLTLEECNIFSSALLYQLGVWYSEKDWVMQLHLGALRNNNTRLLRKLGPDTGFDSIGDWPQAQNLSRFLNHLDQQDHLPKTILYNLNPSSNEVMATMIGNFNDGSIKAKVQFGSAWWFLDQIDGMEKQLNTLSNMGLLSCFIGMLTDSRSFLSYPRHEYFRRILCNLLGRDVHHGLLPNDEKWLGKIVQDICYYNAKEYFKF